MCQIIGSWLKPITTLTLSVASYGLFGAPISAQPVRQETGQVVEFADRYNQRYAGQEPQVGVTLPNVSLFDAEGNPFELASTRGKYTVLVFGCLT